MCGRWYLPIFLLRDGSLTLMNRASLIALVRFWSSLPIMLKLLMSALWPEMLQWSWMGEGDFWCSLFKEHQKSPSPIHDYCNISGHKADINNFSIIGREDQNLTRAIKEALFIRVNDPSLNRNIGKYHLPHIWDEVLHKTTKLKLNHWPSGYSICHPHPQ